MRIVFSTTITFITLSLLATGESRKENGGTKDRDDITVIAVMDWYERLRNPNNSYAFDESTGRYSKAVINRLKSKIPEFKKNNDGSWRVHVSEVNFREENFAYVELTVSDPFFARMYVQVLGKKEKLWHIIDRFTLEGDGPAWLFEFDWDDYYQELKTRKSNQSVGQIPRIKDARD